MTLPTTRRSFLKRSVLAGGSTLLTPGARSEGANSDLRVAVVGVRNRGRHLANVISATKRARLVAICDVDPEILEKERSRLLEKNLRVRTYSDYRKLCEAGDVDAIVVATPHHTHALISITAAVNGKHSYVEKPVSHNVWEGRQMVDAAKAHSVIIHHGYQRRSEQAWREAFDWIGQGHLGKLEIARGFCYKPRPSIGKVKGAQLAPDGLDYDLWCGPRNRSPILRKQFHYDWHWQFPWGNGDLGNSGSHQLDVCRWALGDPEFMPRSVISCGNRFGYDDDGDWPNTQLALIDFKEAPVLFELRGLPKKGMDYKNGMDDYRGLSVGNVIEYEGGSLIGGHEAKCRIVDRDGKEIKRFEGGGSPIRNWIDALHSGDGSAMLSIGSGHLSSSLCHLANISWMLGRRHPDATGIENEAMLEAFARMKEHLAANDIELAQSPVVVGPRLEPEPNGAAFKGEIKGRADTLLSEQYRDEFKLPL